MSLRKGIGFCQQSDSHNCGYFLSSWKDPNFKMFSIIPKQKNKYGNNQQNNSEI